MFDFKSFRKVQEDNNKAVLQHPDGHTIHIAKAAISKPLQKQLAKLPLHQSSPEEPVMPLNNQTGVDRALELTGNDQTVPSDADYAAQAPQEPSMFEQAGSIMANGLSNLVPDASAAVNGITSDSADQSGLAPAQSPIEEVATPPAPSKAQDDEFSERPGYSEQIAGKKAETSAIAQQGQQEAELLKQHAAQEQQSLKDIQTSLGAKAKEIDGVVQDIAKGHINPKQYLENMSTGSKIATAIGLLAGGMASARTGHNPAMDFLQNQIERDINAQKTNLENKHTLLGALQAQYKDQAVADSMFRTIRAHTLATQLEQAAAQAKTPLAQAGMLQFAGQLKQAYYPQVLQSHVMAALSGGSGQAISPATNLALRQRAGLIDPATYKQATEELGKAQQIEKLRANLKDSFDDLNSKALGGRLSPRDRNSAIQTFAGAITHITEGRVQGEMAQKQALALMPDIESKDTRERKLQRIDQLVDTFKTTPVLDGLGIRIAPAPKIQHPVTGKNGKQYMQQGKYMVPVK